MIYDFLLMNNPFYYFYELFRISHYLCVAVLVQVIIVNSATY